MGFAPKGTAVSNLLIMGAQTLADSMRHREATPAHLAMQLLECHETSARLRWLELDADVITSATREVLARLPTSETHVSKLDVALLELIRCAESRAGHSVFGADDLFVCWANAAKDPFGRALHETPAAINALSAWLDALGPELEGAELQLEGFSPGAKFLFTQAQRLADEAGSIEVLPLHVLAAFANFRKRNADKLGLAGVDSPVDVCREAVARLPRRQTTHAFVGLSLIGLLNRLRHRTRPGRPTSQSAVVRALLQETRGPFSQARKWFSLERPPKLEAGHPEVFISAELDADYSTTFVSVLAPAVRAEIYDFDARQPDEHTPRPLAYVAAHQTVVLRAGNGRSSAAMDAALDVLKHAACSNAADDRRALQAAGYDVTAVRGPEQLGGLIGSVVHAARDNVCIELRIFEYGSAHFDTATSVRGEFVIVAMPETPEGGPVTKAELEKLLEVLDDSRDTR